MRRCAERCADDVPMLFLNGNQLRRNATHLYILGHSRATTQLSAVSRLLLHCPAIIVDCSTFTALLESCMLLSLTLEIINVDLVHFVSITTFFDSLK
jgi:hypothetical protein